jgi:RNA polymerase sigma-70 factor (ECF subfamily)
MAETEPNPSGRAEEFVDLYTRYERRLYAYVATLVPQLSDAEDVLQETYRVLWQKFSDYRREDPFLPWAFGVAYREVLNWRQRERTRRKYFSEGIVERLASIEADLDDRSREDYVIALEACLGELSAEESALVEQRYVSGGTLAELATRLERTANALYKGLQRVRRKLLDCIELRVDGSRG